MELGLNGLFLVLETRADPGVAVATVHSSELPRARFWCLNNPRQRIQLRVVRGHFL